MANSWFNPGYKQKLAYHMVLVGAVALLTSSALGVANRFTSAEIAQRLAEDVEVSLKQVVPVPHDNRLLEDTLTLPDKDGKNVLIYRALQQGHVQAVAYRVNGTGYGGSTIILIMGVDATGKILGVRVISHAETPGLGDKIDLAKANWILGFNGRSLGDPTPEKWGVKKDGGVFDQFTGATITPRAVVRAIKGGLEFFTTHRDELLADKPAASASAHP